MAAILPRQTVGATGYQICTDTPVDRSICPLITCSKPVLSLITSRIIWTERAGCTSKRLNSSFPCPHFHALCGGNLSGSRAISTFTSRNQFLKPTTVDSTLRNGSASCTAEPRTSVVESPEESIKIHGQSSVNDTIADFAPICGASDSGSATSTPATEINGTSGADQLGNGELHLRYDEEPPHSRSIEANELAGGEPEDESDADQEFGNVRNEEVRLRPSKAGKNNVSIRETDQGEEGGSLEGWKPEDIAAEVDRRRNFAIISHPDAGKTTLTEKLLLFGGAIHEAGAVKARRAARHATSDWMELEKQRGISITSTAMVFETKGKQITLLDTPGHQDFGEDTYRTLAAADNAVMLVDAGKGLEPQTRKLFEVCRMRRLPVFTFINKMDRPALEALELVDEVEKEFALATYPVNWPIGSGDRFQGVYHRPTQEVHLFRRDATHGARGTRANVVPWGDPALADLIEPDLYEKLLEEVEMLEELTPPLDLEAVRKGDLTPVFFGSAFNNFGVELFLDSFLEYAVKPGSHKSDLGEVAPDYPHFTGFVFKLQANMDPKHRDKVAFVRVCSGVFQKGMKVQLARTGKTLALTRPQKLFAQDRSVLETGFAGDVIGLNNPNAFAIGDSIFVGPRRTFPAIPSFSPELFCFLRNPNPSKYKQFQKGITELLGEGAVQVLHSLDSGRQDPILAAVGQLQFEVVQYRMQTEYGVETSLEPLGFSVARWVQDGWPAVEKAGRLFNCQTVKDQWDRPVLLFRNEWNVGQLIGDHPEIGELAPYALPPVEVAKK